MISFDPTETVPDEPMRRLDALFAERLRQVFEWGRNDCVLFGADAVLAQTGTDHAAAWRGTYATSEEAYALLDSLGGLEVLGALAGVSCAPLTAQRGDIGLCVVDDREHLAVCCGPNWLAPGPRGLVALPITVARLAWRVPRG